MATNSYIKREKSKINKWWFLFSGVAHAFLLWIAIGFINTDDLAQAAREKGHPGLGKALERTYVKNREFPGSFEIVMFVMLGCLAYGYYSKRRDMDKLCNVFINQIAPDIVNGDSSLDYDGVMRMGKVLWNYMTPKEQIEMSNYTKQIALVKYGWNVSKCDTEGIIEIVKNVIERNKDANLEKILSDMAHGQTYMGDWNDRETLYCSDKSEIQKILSDKIMPQLVGKKVNPDWATAIWEFIWQYMNGDEKVQIRQAKYATNFKDTKSVDSMVATVVSIANVVINRNAGMSETLRKMAIGGTYKCDAWNYFGRDDGRAHGAK